MVWATPRSSRSRPERNALQRGQNERAFLVLPIPPQTHTMSSDVAERPATRFEGGIPMNTVVKTQYGEVRGSVADGVNTFKGIPYAAPPFGANRLRPPQPVEPWSGVRDALTFGPKTPQPSYPPEVSVLLPELAITGEDCLTLNIWSPDLGSARQPVMVWIPGSAFEYGTAAMPWYDGSRFARVGIVCVTINYRVGVDGYLYLGEGYAKRALLYLIV